MTLPNQYACVVDTLRQAKLENLCLKATLQEILNLQSQHVIQTHASLIEHTNANKTTNEGIALEETLRIFRVELEKLTGSTTNFGEDERDTPNLTLVTEAILAGKL